MWTFPSDLPFVCSCDTMWYNLVRVCGFIFLPSLPQWEIVYHTQGRCDRSAVNSMSLTIRSTIHCVFPPRSKLSQCIKNVIIVLLYHMQKDETMCDILLAHVVILLSRDPAAKQPPGKLASHSKFTKLVNFECDANFPVGCFPCLKLLLKLH